MNRRNYYKPTGKLRVLVGIGGIHCYCCTIGRKKITKQVWNRMSRRKLKQELTLVSLDTYNELQTVEKRFYEFVDAGAEDHSQNTRVKLVRNALQELQEQLDGDY